MSYSIILIFESFEFSPELKDEYTSKYSPAKAVPLAHTGLVSLEKADSVFFQMVQNGWDGRSYNWEGKDPHTSATFVWEFMCRLFEECPSGNALPNIFLSYTRIQKIMEKRFFTPLEGEWRILIVFALIILNNYNLNKFFFNSK